MKSFADITDTQKWLSNTQLSSVRAVIHLVSLDELFCVESPTHVVKGLRLKRSAERKQI